MVDRTKHIKVRHHFLPQKVEGAGEIVLTYYTPTGDQTMDALTKGLSHEKARKVRKWGCTAWAEGACWRFSPFTGMDNVFSLIRSFGLVTLAFVKR